MSMLRDEWTTAIEEILTDISEAIAVSPAKYQEAKDRYAAVGEYLKSDNSPLARYNPTIFPQGSFALGTAVRPIFDGDDEYDVDAVCRLEVSKSATSQPGLKKLVGDRLKEGRYKDMLELPDGRRCWTINYADEARFHLDVLPAIQDPDWRRFITPEVREAWAKEALCITDKETWKTDGADWPRSNPKGYAEWFRSRMAAALERGRIALAKTRKAEVQNIPDYEVQTPLQRVVQILKRHRDKWAGDDEHKPISIIITTLAARAYTGQETLLEALLETVPRMRSFIEMRPDGTYWVPNPVNPAENFADKWQASPRKRERFMAWLTAAETLARDIVSEQAVERLEEYLLEAFGDRDVSLAFSKRADRLMKSAATRQAIAPVFPGLRTVPHRQSPTWPLALRGNVRVECLHREAGKTGWKALQANGPNLQKGLNLMFRASTTVDKPYSVYWQVVNTGQDAIGKGHGRGSIFPAKSAGVGGLRHSENTTYTGSHYIECFIVKNNQCVARSGEFVVNIA